MNNVAMIVSPCETGKHTITQAVTATRLFGKIVHSETPSAAVDTLLQQQIDIIACPFPDEESPLSALLLKLRERDEWRDIPLLLFARNNQHSNRINALELGASDCLSLNLPSREAAVQIGWHLKNKHRIEQLRRSQANLAHQAVTDSLTGLYNRGYFDAHLNQQIALAQRTDRPMTLLLADLDHFKTINDTYGHQAGDKALQGFAELLKRSARKSDIVCRYGGEEFIVILPECDGNQAYPAAERLRDKVAGHDFGFPLTVSIGLASTSPAYRCNPVQLLENADAALYSAKEKGRNRTEIFPTVSVGMLQQQPGLQQHGHIPKSPLTLPLRRSFAALRKVARYSLI